MPIAWSSGKDKNFYTMSKLKVLEQPKALRENTHGIASFGLLIRRPTVASS